MIKLKFFLSILMLSAASASCAERPDTKVESPEWVSCAGSKRCEAVFLPCHGWVAVVSGHEADAQRLYTEKEKEALPFLDCTTAADVPRPVAVCRAGVCAIGKTGSAP
jgi:hypothetical protein